MIHPSNIFEHAASPHADTRIITKEKLAELREALRGYFKAIASEMPQLSLETVYQLLLHFSFTPDKFVETYTVKYKVK